jgi:hypothetical protein
MRKRLLIAGLTIAVALTIAALLVVYPSRARGEANASGTEVRMDNFTFGPDTLTVPVNTYNSTEKTMNFSLQIPPTPQLPHPGPTLGINSPDHQFSR